MWRVDSSQFAMREFSYRNSTPGRLKIFYAPQLVPAGTAEARISYGNSVCLSVCLSRPGTDSMPDEIETPGLHHMIALSI